MCDSTSAPPNPTTSQRHETLAARKASSARLCPLAASNTTMEAEAPTHTSPPTSSRQPGALAPPVGGTSSSRQGVARSTRAQTPIAKPLPLKLLPDPPKLERRLPPPPPPPLPNAVDARSQRMAERSCRQACWMRAAALSASPPARSELDADADIRRQPPPSRPQPPPHTPPPTAPGVELEEATAVAVARIVSSSGGTCPISPPPAARRISSTKHPAKRICARSASSTSAGAEPAARLSSSTSPACVQSISKQLCCRSPPPPAVTLGTSAITASARSENSMHPLPSAALKAKLESTMAASPTPPSSSHEQGKAKDLNEEKRELPPPPCAPPPSPPASGASYGEPHDAS
mmetsp:Transcript_31951/g.79658  ORF Transcript_31951/g.79658 Transcript_31951/m.79658 type:complete len:348 (+) Transcript_31951:1577-2620(+)